MDYISAVILGTVQGITEFLPVSSSGHLILAREFFGLNSDFSLAVDAVLQLATILAVAIYFFRDFLGLAKSAVSWMSGKTFPKDDRVMISAIALGTVPAVVVGLLLEDLMETTFRNASLVMIMLVAGSILFLFAEHVATQDKELTVRKGVLIGLFQVLALVPGVSRSGSTISGGLILGMSRAKAAKFSFLLAFPVIFGSGMKKLLDLQEVDALGALGVPLAVSFFISFAVGLLSIHFLLRFLRKHTLKAFAIYRVVLAASAGSLLLM